MNILLSCIGRRGYIAEYFRVHLGPNDRIIGTSNSRWTAGFKACDLGVVLPDISNPSYVPTLLTLCHEQQVNALLSFFDPDIDVLSKHLDEFRAIGVMPVMPSAEISNICFDKYRTYLFLNERGFNTPETFVELDQAIRAIDSGKIAFPLMVKPRHGFASRNMFRAHSLKQLEVFYQYGPDMLIQENLKGQEFHLCVCNDLQGRVLSIVPKRKIAMRAGETDQAETSNDMKLVDLGLRLGN